MRFVSFHDDLLGEEVVGRRPPRAICGQRARCSRTSRAARPRRLDPELLEEEPLARHELARQRLAARHVGVRLDPHAADRDEPAVGHRARGSARTARAGPPCSQAYCCAEEAGEDEARVACSIRSSTLEKVRATLRTVSRVGHSQAESMCAWPTARDRCEAVAAAGEASTGRERDPGLRAVPGHVVGVEDVDHPLERAQDPAPGAATVAGSTSTRPSDETSMPRSQPRRPREARQRRGGERCRSGSAGAVAGSPSRGRLVRPGAAHVGVRRRLDVHGESSPGAAGRGIHALRGSSALMTAPSCV